MKNRKWIPVTKALPEEFKNVLVTQRYINADGEEITKLNIGYYGTVGCIDGCGIWSVGGYTARKGEVLAWMPLPEIYKK